MGSKMIQIRHVPEDVHARLKARAAAAGMSVVSRWPCARSEGWNAKSARANSTG